MVIQNSLKLLKELSSLEEKIKNLETELAKENVDFSKEELLLSVLNHQVN